MLDGMKPSKLNYEYLKNLKFLTAFGVHWKINEVKGDGTNGDIAHSTKTQEILKAKDPSGKVLENFKKAIKINSEQVFNEENIRSGKAFEGVSNYLVSRKVPPEKAKELVRLIQHPKTNGINEILASLREAYPTGLITEANLKEMAELAAKGYELTKKVKETETMGIGRKSIGSLIK